MFSIQYFIDTSLFDKVSTCLFIYFFSRKLPIIMIIIIIIIIEYKFR